MQKGGIPVALVTYKDPGIREEAEGLAEAGGYTPVETITIRELKHGRYGVGEGKADLLRTVIQSGKVEQIIVDDRLGVSENYNLSKHCGCEVIDREKLVLQIFAKRALTQEAKLQVKLAELSYELPRVRESVKVQKLGEQPGMFGYGSYEVEKYFRSIKARMDATRKKLAKIESRRDLFRSRRKELNLPVVSVAGYTSAGKTTLFNSLTFSSQPVSEHIFSTLTTTTRRMKLHNFDALLSDTVGFISRLPHYMVEAFKSTLEELGYSDLVILVIDVSDPPERIATKLETCLDTLSDLNVQDENTLITFNKVDKIGLNEARSRVQYLGERLKDAILISAKTGFGLEELKIAVENTIQVRKSNSQARQPVTQSVSGQLSDSL